MTEMSYYMAMQVVQAYKYLCASRGQTTQPITFRQTHITIFCTLVRASSFRSNLLHLSKPHCCTSTRPHCVIFAVRSPRFVSELHHNGVIMPASLWVATHRQ